MCLTDRPALNADAGGACHVYQLDGASARQGNVTVTIQTYWIRLGHGLTEQNPNYVQGVTDTPRWRDQAMVDPTTPVVIEVQFDPKTGGVSATVEKHEPFKARDL